MDKYMEIYEFTENYGKLIKHVIILQKLNKINYLMHFAAFFVAI